MASVFSTLVGSMQGALAHVANITEAERMQLLGAIDQLKGAIEPPIISLTNLSTAAHPLIAARVALGMGVFDAFAAAGFQEQTLEELHPKCKGDKDLLLRIVRLLASKQILQEVSSYKWKPLPIATLLASQAPGAPAIIHFHEHVKSLAGVNDFLEKTGYKQPDDVRNGPWQLGYQTPKTYFEWIADEPASQQAFNAVMKLQSLARTQQWYDFYPVEQNLKTSSDKVLLVDIGGGVGQDLLEFREKFSAVPGQLILEELPQVLKGIDKPMPSGVSTLEYDMFTPQPIKGAKTYYMRIVLHDWPEKQAQQILKNVASAMTGDSLLLIHDSIVQDTTPNPLVSTIDLTMLACFSSLERNEKQWRSLIEAAGLKLNKIYSPTVPGEGNAVLECIKA